MSTADFLTGSFAASAKIRCNSIPLFPVPYRCFNLRSIGSEMSTPISVSLLENSGRITLPVPTPASTTVSEPGGRTLLNTKRYAELRTCIGMNLVRSNESAILSKEPY